MIYLAYSIVLASAFFLIALAVLIFVRPTQAEKFLSLFAGSARAHFTEQFLRLVAGIGFVVYAPESAWPIIFAVFGWLLIVSALMLIVLPWKLHHHFGSRVIPIVIKYKHIYGIGALVLGLLILMSASRLLIK
ncbi:MAG: hypothetical protein ED559_01170 [Phycisphaera sp.]|nr:MAG: hypothetical protein ED559_01170 [Phycisphaera sp.]